MAVLLETSKGDIVIDLYVDEAPNTCKNFLKLCKWVNQHLVVLISTKSYRLSLATGLDGTFLARHGY